MVVKRIVVGNYKNLDITELDCSKMVALVSTNNYGKSNLLEALKRGLDFINYAPKQRGAFMKLVRAIPLASALAGKDFVFSIEFEDPSLGEYRFVRYGYHFAWYNDHGTGARITDETLELRASESVKYTSYLKRAENKYRSSKSTTSFRKLSLSETELAIDAISMIEDVDIADAVKQIKAIGFRLCASLEVNDSFDPNPIEFDLGENISLENEDIPKMLANLREKRSNLFQLFVDTIYDLFPEFSKVELQTLIVEDKEAVKAVMQASLDNKQETDRVLPFRIKDEIHRLVIKSNYLNQPLSMDLMSSGTKRVFWLIANAILADYSKLSLIGIDEIETSIHPKMTQSLLEALSEMLKDTSVIITSHSPFIIRYIKPECIYVGVPNADGVARFKRIQRTKIKTLLNKTRNLETTIGDYLFELMSGDEDSAAVLSAYLEDI